MVSVGPLVHSRNSIDIEDVLNKLQRYAEKLLESLTEEETIIYVLAFNYHLGLLIDYFRSAGLGDYSNQIFRIGLLAYRNRFAHESWILQPRSKMLRAFQQSFFQQSRVLG